MIVMNNKTNYVLIITVLYSIIVIPIIIVLFNRIFDAVAFSFVEISSIFGVLIYMFILFLFILPYILLIINKKKKSKYLSKGTIIYEIAIVVLFVVLLWIIWPTIKQSITGCWHCIESTDGKTVCGVCN